MGNGCFTVDSDADVDHGGVLNTYNARDKLYASRAHWTDRSELPLHVLYVICCTSCSFPLSTFIYRVHKYACLYASECQIGVISFVNKCTELKSVALKEYDVLH